MAIDMRIFLTAFLVAFILTAHVSASNDEEVNLPEFCQKFSQEITLDPHGAQYVAGVDSRGNPVASADVTLSRYARRLNEKLIPDEIKIRVLDSKGLDLSDIEKEYLSEADVGLVHVKNGKVFLENEPLGELDYLTYLCEAYLSDAEQTLPEK